MRALWQQNQQRSILGRDILIATSPVPRLLLLSVACVSQNDWGTISLPKVFENIHFFCTMEQFRVGLRVKPAFWYTITLTHFIHERELE